jgi:hypothetical protein
MDLRSVNHTRYIPGQKNGHYESFFQRANHPELPLAFWIRYTIFSPDRHPEKAIGETWAVFFDGRNGKHISVKKEVPLEKCFFNNKKFEIKLENAFLENDILRGDIASGTNTFSWNLRYYGDQKPLFVLPENLYEGNFPKAKLLVGMPMASYNGQLLINDNTIEINNWTGSQNHNWGSKHTDNYAWGQIAGFDNSPASFFEISTARLKFGPLWTPFMTLMVLRHKEYEFRLNTVMQSLKANGKFTSDDKNSEWRFLSVTPDVSIEGVIRARSKDFVELTYYNPPGGNKRCLNSKIASCKIRLNYKNNNGEKVEAILETAHRAAFEILS